MYTVQSFGSILTFCPLPIEFFVFVVVCFICLFFGLLLLLCDEKVLQQFIYVVLAVLEFPGICSVDQAGLKLRKVFLPLPPQC